MTSPVSKPANPFVGPRSFKENEKLYGRDRETARLINLLIAERIILLYSPSGAGKTSLIHAVLLPRLKQRRFQVRPVLRVNREPGETGSTNPVFSTPGYNRYVFSALLSIDSTLPEDQQLEETALARLRLCEYLDQHPLNSPELLIFDQFEEVLTLDPTDQDEKIEFFNQVGEALENRGRWALFSMREDFIAALDPFLNYLPTRLANTFRLELLNEQSALEAVQMPARDRQVEFTNAAAQKLVNDLRRVRVQAHDGTVEERPGPYVEPVQLQVVCSSLWEKLDLEDREISEEDLQAVGDVDTALGDYYSSRVAAIATESGVHERLVREWIDHKLITEQGLRGQIMENPSGASEGLNNQVLRRLEDVHLLRSETRRGITWYELAHDRLVKPVRMNNQAWFEANLSLLQRQAEVWERAEHPDGMLLRGQALLDAEKWAGEHPEDLTRTERNFLRACREALKAEEEERQRAQDEQRRAEEALKYEAAQRLAAAESQRAEAERQRAEEKAQAAKKLRTRLIFAVVGAVLAIAFAGIAANNMYVAQTQSQANAVLAQQRDVAARTAEAAGQEALYQRDLANAGAATASAAQLVALAAEATAEAASQQAIEERDLLAIAEAKARRESQVAFSRQLAALSLQYLDAQPSLASLLAVEAYHAAPTYESKDALLSRLGFGLDQLIQEYGRPLPAGKDDVLAVALSPDGQRLAWGTEAGEIILWNYQDQALQRRWTAHRRAVNGLTFSPDGALLVSASDNGEVILWDAATGRQQRSMVPVINAAYSVAFNRDSSRLAAAVGSRVVVWDMRSFQVITNLDAHTDFVTSVAWSAQGGLASAGDDQRVILWDLDNASPLFIFRQQVSPVKAIAWFPDGSRLASASRDGTIDIIDTRSGRLAAQPLQNEARDSFLSLAISQDGSLIAGGTETGQVMLWDARSLEPSGTLQFHIRDVTSLAFTPHRGQTLLVSGSVDNSVGMFEIVTQQPLGTQAASGLGALYTVMMDGESREWRAGRLDRQAPGLFAANPRGASLTLLSPQGELGTLALPQGSGLVLAASQDGGWTAAGSSEGEIWLYPAGSYENPQVLEARFGTLVSLAFSRDGSVLVSTHCLQPLQEGDRMVCAQNEARLWSLPSGQPLGKPVSGHTDFIVAAAVDPAHNLLATGSRDKTVLLWNTETGELTGLAMNMASEIRSMAISPDGATLACGFENGDLSLWDIASNQRIGEPIKDVPAALTALAFNDAGQVLLSAHQNGSVIAWDVNEYSWYQRACDLAGRNLTPEEWRQFFPEEEYQATCEQWSLAR